MSWVGVWLTGCIQLCMATYVMTWLKEKKLLFYFFYYFILKNGRGESDGKSNHFFLQNFDNKGKTSQR